MVVEATGGVITAPLKHRQKKTLRENDENYLKETIATQVTVIENKYQ